MTNTKIHFHKINKSKTKDYKDFRENFIQDLSNSKNQQKIYLQLALEEYEKEKNLENFLLTLKTLKKCD